MGYPTLPSPERFLQEVTSELFSCLQRLQSHTLAAHVRLFKHLHTCVSGTVLYDKHEDVCIFPVAEMRKWTLKDRQILTQPDWAPSWQVPSLPPHRLFSP